MQLLELHIKVGHQNHEVQGPNKDVPALMLKTCTWRLPWTHRRYRLFLAGLNKICCLGGVQWAQSGSNAYGTVNQTQTPSPQSGSYNNHGQKPKPSPSQSNITPYSSGSSKPSPSKQAQNPYQGSSQSLSGMGAREADKKLSEMLGDGLSLKTHRWSLDQKLGIAMHSLKLKTLRRQISPLSASECLWTIDIPGSVQELEFLFKYNNRNP